MNVSTILPCGNIVAAKSPKHFVACNNAPSFSQGLIEGHTKRFVLISQTEVIGIDRNILPILEQVGN